jgi:hypothetical protein
VAYAIVRNEVEADTISQDTFIQAYTHLAKFQAIEFETAHTHRDQPLRTARRRRFVSLFTGGGDDSRPGDGSNRSTIARIPSARSWHRAARRSRRRSALSTQQK